MADALTLDVTIDAIEAQATLDRLYDGFRKTGDSALEAHTKVEKFEKSYRDGAARKNATAELDKLTRSTTHAGTATDGLTGATTKGAKATEALTGAVMRYAAPAAIGAAMLSTIRWADSIANAAERTHLTTTQVQQLTKMADKSGSSFNAMAGMIQTVEQKLTSHNKKAEEAVKLMGMAPEALMRMDPLERLRAIAQGLAALEDPAQRSAAEVAILGQKADLAAPALNKLAEGADKAESALGDDFIRVGAAASSMFDTLTNKALDLGKAMLLLPAVMTDRIGNWAKDSTLGTWAEMQGWHGDRATKGPTLGDIKTDPKSPFWRPPTPSPLSVPDPFAPGGVGGNSMSFIERTLGIKIGRKGRASSAPDAVVPYTANQWANISQVLGPRNPLGNGGLGSFPGWAPSPLQSSMSTSALGLGFDRNSMMVPFSAGATMRAPGAAGGSWMSKLFGGGKASNLAAGGLGLLSSMLPGLNRTGQSIGSMAGSFFGPMGSALGGLVGGLGGKLFGTSQKKLARNAEVGEVFKQFSSKEFIDLQKEADKFGISMNKALTAKTMKDFGAAVDEVNEKLREMNAIQSEIDYLTEQTTVGFDKMKSVVNEFGLDINKLGPAFKQQEINAQAQKIIDAFAIMEKGGADMNGVLDGMSDEISTVVQNSIKFGTEIPNNMKPWIEKLAASGQLVDENGEKITDISKLKFGEKLESEMDKFVRKLGELIDKLAGVKAGFNAAEGAAGDFNNEAGRVPDGPDGPHIPDPVMPSRGGIIGNRGELRYLSEGGFVPRGTDTVPAMLSPGEMVTPADATTEIVRSIKERRSPGDVHILPIFLDGRASDREMVDEVFRQLPRRVAGNDANSRAALQRILGAHRVH